ncbi:MAG: carbon-nitrogen hydrolase family protein [Rhizobiales bacterium]|nr:carbon-nitrogen hydrolase family protein [Hyphomicrobiales bacterium]
MTARTLRVALAQQRATRDIAENLEITRRQVREAAAAGAQYVQTPECTNTLELDKQRLRASISDEAGCTVLAAFRDLARETAVWLHIGSMTFLEPDGRIANRSVLIAPDGRLVARYDKLHMFDVDLDGGESYRESHTYRAGGEAVVAEIGRATLGLTICYDLRFAYLYRALAQAGAEILTVPAAFTRQTGEAHWHVLLRARAIETGCYVMAAAQGGRHDSGRETYGHSLVVSPWGEVIAEAAGDEPGLVHATLDLSAVGIARGRVPALRHDRTFPLRRYIEDGDLVLESMGVREAS